MPINTGLRKTDHINLISLLTEFHVGLIKVNACVMLMTARLRKNSNKANSQEVSEARKAAEPKSRSSPAASETSLGCSLLGLETLQRDLSHPGCKMFGERKEMRTLSTGAAASSSAPRTEAEPSAFPTRSEP